ncbi:uncharacterized protein BCR38DRAFT_441189 [Pseudomassariella vexata]|uniref:WW domain-containing protein n=1 Tax=Pseudomassariella vexata TaxID=1141098 RepID=A0A1Y2DRA4_9PEZI|nr:uncharacterized protein BCR38DRAFT_441189 [Pseudomassariella vexata]ORY61801.1 hypothetical protein BCR38DRAFT_441189 [Pseudomassariella vexata]
MLKSTYQPSSSPLPPLPPGWTEHKAPTGHTYYFNQATQTSTYTRPASAPGVVAEHNPHASFQQYSAVPNLADPAVANAWQAQYNPQAQTQPERPRFGGRGGHHGAPDARNRPRPEPRDKPRSKVAIPGCEPWILVYTKYGRRFAYNPVKKASFWRIPEKVMKRILDLDIQSIQEKAGAVVKGDGLEPIVDKERQAQAVVQEELEQEQEQEEFGSDYEEVEVTDEEDMNAREVDEDNEHASKRQRIEDQDQPFPVEFSEEDIAFQLQAMGADYGLEPGEYDDGDPSAWPEGAEGIPLSDVDTQNLFKDLLSDYGISPFSPWEKIIEDGKIVEDPRYTVLTSMKARREVWEEWSRERIAVIKERRAKEEKRDPRIPYMAFLQEKANTKLYWPEFRRKYKKEPPMRDMALSDKEREKWYREYVSRLKMPQDTLKKDLTALLRSIPAKDLNNKTLLESLPPQVLADVRFISLDPQTRNPLVEGYISTLDPPPEVEEVIEDETVRKSRHERAKRERALADRERVVAEEKRRQQRQLAHGRAILREEEMELERAMRVDKKGLQSQLMAVREKDSESNH